MTVLRQVTDRVWLFPPDPDPAVVRPGVGVIADAGGCVLVDAGHSPAIARQVAAAIAAAGLPPARRLVYTHHHWDHVWGACAWPDVEIIGHRSGARLLVDEADRPWSDAYLREQVAANPRLGPSFRARARAMPDWTGFTVVPPHTEFDDALTLPEGVDVRHVGGGHAPDSTVVVVPDDGVLFIGDAIYPPPYHLRRADDGFDLVTAHRLLDPDEFGQVAWFVAAHDDPWTRAEVGPLLDSLA
jgi:glyoxylase-like metal-dependent hydrolase (beta-lactamase superfamily II)